MGSRLIKFITRFTWQPLLNAWLQKERPYSYKGIRITVKPGVFHPGFFFSSLLLLNYVNDLNLRNKKLLDLGSGAGLLSIAAANKGAVVTSTDISKTAIENTAINALRNNVTLQVHCSDLFDSIPYCVYDVVTINPPYFKKHPVTEADYAWYCGPELEYYQKLFRQLPPYTGSDSKIYMVLSGECDISGICELAVSGGYYMSEVLQKSNWLERNFIFELGRK